MPENLVLGPGTDENEDKAFFQNVKRLDNRFTRQLLFGT